MNDYKWLWIINIIDLNKTNKSYIYDKSLILSICNYYYYKFYDSLKDKSLMHDLLIMIVLN